MPLIPRDSLFDIDRFFAPFSSNFFAPIGKEGADQFFSPHIDIKELDDHYEIKADLPGVNKDDLSVHLEDGVLTIEAKTEEEKSEEKEGKVIRKERRTGTYLRSFDLGNQVQESDINAIFKDGLLTLTAPKVAAVENTKKRIDIS